MKKIIFTSLLFFLYVIPAHSQFGLKSAVGVGVQIKSDYSYDVFQTTLSVVPQWNIGKLNIGGVVQTFISDSATVGYIGSNVNYPVWENEKQSLTLGAQYTKGDEGKQLIGGVLGYNNDKLGLDLNISQEYKSKSTFLLLSLFYTLTD